jgi:hypothetical protein
MEATSRPASAKTFAPTRYHQNYIAVFGVPRIFGNEEPDDGVVRWLHEGNRPVLRSSIFQEHLSRPAGVGGLSNTPGGWGVGHSIAISDFLLTMEVCVNCPAHFALRIKVTASAALQK